MPFYFGEDPRLPVEFWIYAAAVVGALIAVGVMVVCALRDAARSMVLSKDEFTRDLAADERRKRLQRQQRRGVV